MVKIVFSHSRPTFPSKKSSVGELAQPRNFHRILTRAIAYNDMKLDSLHKVFIYFLFQTKVFKVIRRCSMLPAQRVTVKTASFL